MMSLTLGKGKLTARGIFRSRGVSARWPGTLESVAPNLPYIVVYEIGPAHIEIIAVFHADDTGTTRRPRLSASLSAPVIGQRLRMI